MRYPAYDEVGDDESRDIYQVDIQSIQQSGRNKLVNESSDQIIDTAEGFVEVFGNSFYLNMSIDDKTPGKLKIGFRSGPSLRSETVSYLELPPSTVAMAEALERENISLLDWCKTVAEMTFDTISVTTGFPRENMKFSIVKTVRDDIDSVIRRTNGCWNLSKLIYEANGADWSDFAMFDD